MAYINIGKYKYKVDCVYIVYNPLTDLHKIGWSLDAMLRLKDLITQTGAPLEMVMYIESTPSLAICAPSAGKRVETDTHIFCKEYLVEREWFFLSPMKLVEIELFWYRHDLVDKIIKHDR
jgi:hypothetical protein